MEARPERSNNSSGFGQSDNVAFRSLGAMPATADYASVSNPPYRLCDIVRNRPTFPPASPTDLPGGRRADFSVQPPTQKYSGFPKTQITAISTAVSSHSKGRIAIVTNAGRDAVDAAASDVRSGSQGGLLSVSDLRHARRTALMRTA